MDRRNVLTVGLLSLSLVALELVWTRLFSAEFFYTFAFLTLSLAIMGLGLGALAVRLIPRLRSESALPPALAAVGIAMLAGPPAVFGLGLDFSRLLASGGMVGNFVVAVGLLTAAFVAGGVALAIVFRSHPEEISRLYMADLVGAGAGVVAAVAAMNLVGTPAATFLCPAPVLLAAVLVCRGWRKAVPAALVATSLTLALFGAPLLVVARPEPAPVVYTHWDAMAKIKAYAFGDEALGLNIDNLANTAVIGFDGTWSDVDPRAAGFGIDVGHLIRRFPACTFMSLGSGGGGDVFQALAYGAREVHAVEVNPQINRLLLDSAASRIALPGPDGAASAGRPPAAGPKAGQVGRSVSIAEFSGSLYHDPRVVVATEDARSYAARHANRFDVIYSLSSNTFAALASGSFALAENYLFTTEAFKDYWRALTARGFLVMEHQFYMPRLVGSALDALRELGVPDPESHLAVYDLPTMRRNVLVLAREPLDDDLRRNALVIQGQSLTAGPADGKAKLRQLYPPPESNRDNLVARIVTQGWRKAAPAAQIDVSPTTDDRPFVGQMGLWRNVDAASLKNLRFGEVNGFPLAKVMIVAILVIVGVVALPLTVVPVFFGPARLPVASWLYFFGIGVAFMAVEVVLIQKYTLFVGPAVYSIATILATLLVASGLGSRVSDQVPDWVPFAGIALWLGLDAAFFPLLVDALQVLPLFARVALTALLVAPLGVCMGMPFPKAVARVGALVDWGFAVNGVASVVGATAVLPVVFAFGFRWAEAGSAFLYLSALALLSLPSGWRREEATG